MRADRRDGGHQVALAQRDLLRPAGGAAGMQHDGYVVRGGALERLLKPTRLAVGEQVRRTVSALGDGDQRSRGSSGGRAGSRNPAGGHQHQPGRDVGKKETELSFGVRRVKRRRSGSERGNGKQDQYQVRAIGQGERDAIAAPDAQGSKPPRERLGSRGDLRLGQNQTRVGNDQCRAGSIPAIEQLGERLVSVRVRSAHPHAHNS